MKIDNGGPAFPNHPSGGGQGMSLRDWFAGQALAGIAARYFQDVTTTPPDEDFLPDDERETYDVVVDECYVLADAMISKKREGEK